MKVEKILFAKTNVEKDKSQDFAITQLKDVMITGFFLSFPTDIKIFANSS